MFIENLIWIGVCFSLIGQFFYIRSIIRGYTKPNLITWSIWMVAPFIAVFFQLKAGAGISVVPVFMTGFGPLIILITAIATKNSFWKINTFDIYCGLFSILALILYISTHNLEISILFAIISDGLAAIPTITKSWKFPETEISINYFIAFATNILGLLVIKEWSFTIYSFGFYNVLVNIIIVFCINRKKIFKNFNTV